MRKAENRNAPMLWGWVIAAAAGLVAFGALMVVGGFALMPAAAIAAVLVLVVGLILGMPWGAERGATPVRAPAEAAKAATGAATGAGHAAAAGSAPAAAPMTTPAAAVSAIAAVQPAAVQPAAVQPAAAAGASAPAGPLRLKAPRDGRPDDLKEIEGIGPALEKLVNELGFYHFDQIAGWSDADVARVDAEMKGFKGRIARDRWVAQARIIVAEGLEAFRIRAKTNRY